MYYEEVRRWTRRLVYGALVCFVWYELVGSGVALGLVWFLGIMLLFNLRARSFRRTRSRLWSKRSYRISTRSRGHDH